MRKDRKTTFAGIALAVLMALGQTGTIDEKKATALSQIAAAVGLLVARDSAKEQQ